MTDEGFGNVLTRVEQLEQHYRPASSRVLAKVQDQLDEACRRFIAASPLVMVGTVSGAGIADVSPRGGPPGFVKVLDERRLALPDLNGNNRLDTLHNVIERQAIGLLFVIPGRDETLRVNGRAVVTTAAHILDRFTDELRRPATAIGVEVATAFLQCGKAFRRGSVWDPERWPAADSAPSSAEMFRQHLGLTEVPVERVAADLEAGYRAGLEADRPATRPSTRATGSSA